MPPCTGMKTKKPVWGLPLVERMQQTRRDLAEWPHAAPLFATAHDGTAIRGKAVEGYPYRIVYTVEPEMILILAYAHDRREPGYWLHRLE